MDKLIEIGIILFILSLISERLTNYIKLYLPILRQDKETPPEVKDLEKQRKRVQKRERITFLLALVCGLVTAFASKADLFLLINTPTVEYTKALDLGWEGYKESGGKLFQTLLGCFLTGIFLSFGSKFWHDALDLLFQIKNLRRKAVEALDIKNLEELKTKVSEEEEEKPVEESYSS